MTELFDLGHEPGLGDAGVLDDAAWLRAWERARDLERPWRELELLAAALRRPRSELADLPIGRRDSFLLELRETRFGRRLEVVAACPACAATLEVELDTATLRRPGQGIGRDGRPGSLEDGDLTITFRLPTSSDVAAVAGSGDPEAAILERCVLAARRGKAAVAAADLPPAARQSLAAAMADLDPLAEIALDLACPSCGHAWAAPLDPAAILSGDIDAWAERLMHDVSELARAFGWREPDVLALGPVRRQRYLELATA